MKAVKKMKKRMKRVLLVLCGLMAISSGQPASARDPFAAPAPSQESFDYPAAARQIELRGLVRTEKGARAVLYLGKEGGLRVVKPADEVTVMLSGLRHRFRVQVMEDRTVVLAGDNGETYNIGVVERTGAKN